MLFSSNITINNSVIYIVNIYDISDIYAERDRQMKEVIFSDIIILGIASVFIIIFSAVMTKPIKILNNKAKKIANGDFSSRVDIKSSDEIGELANSFNTMSEEIEKTIKSLEFSIKQKNDFINGFTHELKTPMTAIVGYADLLRLKRCDEEVTKKAINYIYNETKRLEKLSHKLMELMALSEESLELEEIDIRDFVTKVSNRIVNLEGIKLVLEVEDASIKGDK